MTRIFVDTSFFIALVSPGDRFHFQADRWFYHFDIPLVTTEYVMVEVANWLASRGVRHLFGELMLRVQTDPTTLVIPGTTELFNAGVDLYQNRPDKDWSLTDCISFVAMERHGLTEALTADHHFAQAGFKVLL